MFYSKLVVLLFVAFVCVSGFRASRYEELDAESQEINLDYENPSSDIFNSELPENARKLDVTKSDGNIRYRCDSFNYALYLADVSVRGPIKVDLDNEDTDER